MPRPGPKCIDKATHVLWTESVINLTTATTPAAFEGWCFGSLYLDLELLESKSVLVESWGNGCEKQLEDLLRRDAYLALDNVDLKDIHITCIRETHLNHTQVVCQSALFDLISAAEESAQTPGSFL